MKVITDLPKIEGSWIEDLTNIGNGRHLILLPLTKRAIIQYCTKFIVNNLKVSVIFYLSFVCIYFYENY